MGDMEKTFCLKKWNGVAMWKWDVECDICAICRVQVMGKHQPLDTTSDQQSHCALNRNVTFEKSHLYRTSVQIKRISDYFLSLESFITFVLLTFWHRQNCSIDNFTLLRLCEV